MTKQHVYVILLMELQNMYLIKHEDEVITIDLSNFVNKYAQFSKVSLETIPILLSIVSVNLTSLRKYPSENVG